MSYVVQSDVVWVAAYLLWFSLCLLLGDDDCSVELGCHVVTRPPVGRKRWYTAGCAVDWPEVCSGIEEATTGADVGLSAAAGCLDEPWCSRSTRLHVRVVGVVSSVLMYPYLKCCRQLLLSEWMNLVGQAKSSQAKVLTGAETWAKHKLTSPCLVAIRAFDRITGLSNRHLNSNRGICLR